MKRIILLSLLFVIGLNGDFSSFFGSKKNVEIDVVIGNKAEQELKSLSAMYNTMTQQEKVLNESLYVKLEQVKADIVSIQELSKESYNELISKQLLVAKATKHVLITIKSTFKDRLIILKNHLNLIEEYIKEEKNQQLLSEKKLFYAFEDLQKITYKIVDQEDRVLQINNDKNEIKGDLENNRKKLSLIQASLSEKNEHEQKISDEIKDDFDESGNMNLNFQLLELELRLIEYEKDLTQKQIELLQTKLIYCNDCLAIEEKKLLSFKIKRASMVNISLRVTEMDVKASAQEVENAKKDYLTQTDEYLHSIEQLSNQNEIIKLNYDESMQKYRDMLGGDFNIEEWFLSVKTAENYKILVELACKHDHALTIERNIDYIRAQIDLIKNNYNAKKMEGEIVNTWYGIKHQHFASQKELQDEIKQYKDMIKTLEREQPVLEDKRASAVNRLNLCNKSISNITDHENYIKDQKHLIFERDHEGYVFILKNLDKAKKVINKRMELIGKSVETYSTMLNMIGISIRRINTMFSELHRISLWHRSGGAISREGIKNFFPDIFNFIIDISNITVSYVTSFNWIEVSEKISLFFSSPYLILFLLFKFLFLLFIFIILYRYLPIFSKDFIAMSKEYRSLPIISLLMAVLANFLFKHIFGVFIWLILFSLIVPNSIADVYPAIMFYIFSIPYSIYIARDFTNFLKEFNEENNYALFAVNFQKRFLNVFLTLLYSTIIIWSLKEAFILGAYTKSEVPTILLSFYSILVRILLLTLLRKEDLLSIVPTTNPFYILVRYIIYQYYYLFLATTILIMVMSDPYVGGYDNLVYYFLWGIIGTVVVSQVSFVVYGFLRRSSSSFFFVSEKGILKERFYFSKTWYGLSIIGLFLLFAFISILLIAWIWSKPISLYKILEILRDPRLTIGVKDGIYQKLSLLTLIKTFMFIPFGFLIAFLLDKFIVHRILSILLVDKGVHSAVSTITYYIVILMSITVGLLNAGLAFLIAYYLMPLLIGMAWAMKDIFNDFIAYFVLLVQRPLKIGDYIQLDKDIMGVVRSITPRAVILRRKRSYTIVVPNSRIIRDVILNWDYSKNYLAFPDIHITIGYHHDPDLIKDILEKSVDNNPNVLNNPPPVIRLEEFGEYGYVFLIRGFISSEKTLLQWYIASEVRFAIVALLRKNNVKIAIPSRLIKVSQQEDEVSILNDEFIKN